MNMKHFFQSLFLDDRMYLALAGNTQASQNWHSPKPFISPPKADPANAIELVWLSRGRTLVIKIGKTLDLVAHKEFCRAYESASNDVHTYVVDFLKTTWIDNSVLGMLLLLRDHVGGDRERLYLMNLGPEVRKTLDAVDFESMFTMGAIATPVNAYAEIG